ncbi:MAG: ATP-binding cassette domain-containing protein [Pseudomonadota bacterium]
MADAPLLQLSEIALTFGGDPVFRDLDLIVQPRDRIALVGRNGSGKSTLMKVMAGLVEADAGTRAAGPGIQVGYMEQDPDLSVHATLGDFATAALDPAEHWRAERAADGIGLALATPTDTASGGERRRAALVRIMAEAPDLMLLDEPTNHLDIDAIAWLEAELAQSRAAVVLISHDRRVLETVTRATLWLDRGQVRRLDKGFAAFEDWRDKTWAEEDEARHKLDRKIKAEARWAVEGISARRKRNQGRVRALGDLRRTRADMIRRQGTADMAFGQGPKSGRKVIEADDITKTWGENTVLRPLSLRVARGDRLALIGPNGAGKTTLLNILLGREAPDSGKVTLGTGLEIALFDQRRAALDPEMTLWDSLTGDPDMRVSGRADQVMVRGRPQHVVGYLKSFLFDEAQARAPVRALSGGERARLLLAKLMAQPSNLLVLDEPTNDLDLETLDLLQELIADYDGTVLLVSHDRDFLDRTATRTLTLEKGGRATLYAGGYSDAVAQRGEAGAPEPATTAKAHAAPKQVAKPAAPAGGLTFTERHRLDALPAEIARLEAEIARLATFLSDAEIHAKEPAKAAKATEALALRQTRLSEAEDEWLALEAKSES